MKILILILILSRSITTQAQDTIPDIQTLYNSIDTFYQQQLEAELKAFEANPKDYWMNFVPSVGIAYTPSGAPRPSISFSLNSLLQVRTQKRQVAALRKSIVMKNGIERQTTKKKVNNILRRIKYLEEDLLFSQKVFEIDKALFEFHQKQADNHDITPSNFLLKKRDFLKKEETIRLEIRKIKLLIIELYEIGHL